jgi:hypothetical protein
LKNLDAPAQKRVLEYVTSKLNLQLVSSPPKREHEESRKEVDVARPSREPSDDNGDEETDGISPVAKKWMKRNGLQSTQLGAIFSLGVDEIDLVAKSVPGKGKKDRMRAVFLLKGIAAYLGGGAARFTHEQVKEACLHYDAFDAPNFASNFKSMSIDVSGAKESGYVLTAHGMASATDLLKQMIAGAQKAN